MIHNEGQVTEQFFLQFTKKEKELTTVNWTSMKREDDSRLVVQNINVAHLYIGIITVILRLSSSVIIACC